MSSNSELNRSLTSMEWLPMLNAKDTGLDFG